MICSMRQCSSSTPNNCKTIASAAAAAPTLHANRINHQRQPSTTLCFVVVVVAYFLTYQMRSSITFTRKSGPSWTECARRNVVIFENEQRTNGLTNSNDWRPVRLIVLPPSGRIANHVEDFAVEFSGTISRSQLQLQHLLLHSIVLNNYKLNFDQMLSVFLSCLSSPTRSADRRMCDADLG